MITPASGANVLDLRDLLAGAGPQGLINFPHFEQSGGNTIVQTGSTGVATDTHPVGAPSGVVVGAQDYKTALASVDMIGLTTPDQQVIQDLLTRVKPHTD